MFAIKYLFYILLLAGPYACGQEDSNLQGQLKGKVVSIADGDTFTLLTAENKQVKVRLHGIDAPEKKQPFGQRAKQHLSKLVFGKQVKLSALKKDRYGRTLGIVYDESGGNVNESMLRAGMAWHFKRYDKNITWARLEREARNNRVGLWSQPGAIAPWKWRKQR